MRRIVGYSALDGEIEQWTIDEEKWAEIAQRIAEFRRNSSTTYWRGELEETLHQYAGEFTNLDTGLCLWIEEVDDSAS